LAEEPAEGTPVAAGAGEVVHKAAKPATPTAPPDPRWQALLSNTKISPSKSGPGFAIDVKKNPEIVAGQEMVRAVDKSGVDWKHAPADQRMAMLAVGGAYQPPVPLAQRVRTRSAASASRRQFNLALAVAWGAVAATTATGLAMFQDFFGPRS